MDKHFDCLIVGGGPAGLTAALTLARQRHTAAVFDSGEYHNAGASYMHTVATWDHKSPSDFRRSARENTLSNYSTVTYIDAPVESVRKDENGTTKAQNCFELRSRGATYYGAKLVLASGCTDLYPEIPGFLEAWPSGIFHCLFCHGYEERDAESCGLLAVGPMGSSPEGALHFARNCLQLTKKVTVYTNGVEKLAQDVDAQAGEAKSRLSTDARKITRIEKSSEAAEVILHFEGDSSKAEAFLMHMPLPVIRGNLIEQLGVETNMGNVVPKTMFNETSVRGVFAAGDIMTHQKVFNNALASGCSAGAGVAVQLQADNWGHKPLVGH